MEVQWTTKCATKYSAFPQCLEIRATEICKNVSLLTTTRQPHPQNSYHVDTLKVSADALLRGDMQTLSLSVPGARALSLAASPI